MSAYDRPDESMAARSEQGDPDSLPAHISVPLPLLSSTRPDLPAPVGGMRIYVSSTARDLLGHRRAVLEMLRKHGYSYVAQEEYVAEDRWPLEKCLDDVCQCNVYLGFFAWRYGFAPPGHTLAITEQEYRQARSQRATCLCFLLDDDHPWPKNLIDDDQGPIQTLRKEISESAMIGFFRTEESLALQVAAALDKLSKAVARRLSQSAAAPSWEGTLENCLSPALRGEFEGIVARARRHLLQPLPGRFTDHSVEQKRRLHERLNKLLLPWALRQREQNEGRVQVELFVLLTAVYLHDLGLWPAHDAEQLPQVVQQCPSLRKAFEQEGHPLPLAGVPCSLAVMRFIHRYHHLITADVLTRAGLSLPGDPLPNLGLRSAEFKPLVAQVCTLQNEWELASDPLLNAPYENRFAEPETDAGPIRVAWLAAFLRLALALDVDHKRLDIERLTAADLPEEVRARWWKHHFVKTCRLEPRPQDGSFPVRLAFRLPEAHEDQRDWLVPALYSATADALRGELQRLADWLAPAHVWLDVPPQRDCQFEIDVTGQTRPMSDQTLRVFRRIHPLARTQLTRQALRRSLETDDLTADGLAADIPPLVLHAAITHYLTEVEHVFESGFRDRPYTALELEYSGSQREALELLIHFAQRAESPVKPVVVVGDPGGGKTTLLRRFILELAQRPDCEQFVPIFVEAKFFGDERWAEAFLDRIARVNDARQAAGATAEARADAEYEHLQQELREHLERHMARVICDLAGVAKQPHEDRLRHYLREALQTHTVVLVIDGLNELPREMRYLAVTAADAFARHYKSHRLIVSSRVGDYQESWFPNAHRCAVLPLDEPSVRRYWTGIGISPSQQDRVFQSADRSLASLVSNPMFMYMAGEVLHEGRVEAIDRPGRLHREFTRRILERWHERQDQPLLSAEQLHDLLAEVAFQAFYRNEVSFDQTVIDTAVDQWPRAPSDAGERSRLVAELLGSGLLRQQSADGQTRFAFLHHTTQDYLAASVIPSRVQDLPEFVSRPVFHEALRLVVDLIPEPNQFLRELMAATSERVEAFNASRASLMPLCFRVAGAMRGRIEPEVFDLLFASVLGLVEFTCTLRHPYGVLALDHLFASLGWQELACFFRFLKQNEQLPGVTRRFAARQLEEVAGRMGDPTPEERRRLLDPGLSAEAWHDHEAARAVLLAATPDQAGFPGENLLLDGLAASVSLTASEKKRMCAVARRLTPHQVGSSQMILVDEQGRFGSLVLFDYGHFEYRQNLHALYAEYQAALRLHEPDYTLQIGDTVRAFDGYLDQWDSFGNKARLLTRLILFSREMSGEQRERLAALIRSYHGAGLEFSAFAQLDGRFEFRDLSDRLAIHADIQYVLDQTARTAANPWLVLFCDQLLMAHRRDYQPALPARFDDLTAGMDWSTAEGLLFLQNVLSNPRFDAGLHTTANDLVRQHHPETVRKNEELLRTLADRCVTGARRDTVAHLVSLAPNMGRPHDPTAFGSVFTAIWERLEAPDAIALVDDVTRADRVLGRLAKLVGLGHVARQADADALRALMDRWHFTHEQLADSLAAGGPAVDVFQTLLQTDDRDSLLQAVGWPEKFSLIESPGFHPLDAVLANIVSKLCRLIEIFTAFGDHASALDGSLILLRQPALDTPHERFLERIGNQALQSLKSLREVGDTEGFTRRVAELRTRLMRLMAEPEHAVWSAALVWKMIDERAFAEPAAETQAAVVSTLLQALHTAVERHPDLQTIVEDPTQVLGDGRLTGITDPKPIAGTIWRIATATVPAASPKEDAPPVPAAEMLQPLTDRLFALLFDWNHVAWAFGMLEAIRKNPGLDESRYADAQADVMLSPKRIVNTDLRHAMIDRLKEMGHLERLPACLERFVEELPSEGSAAADGLGNAAFWYYLCRDLERFAELTDRALAVAPVDYRRDWLVANRAFARLLSGDRDAALAGYRDVRELVADRTRWLQVAVEDLEQHPSRWSGAAPIGDAFIAAVRALGDDLPEKAEG